MNGFIRRQFINLRFQILTLSLLTVLGVSSIETSFAARLPPTNPTIPYRFGVVNDLGQYHDDLWNRGVRAVTFELQWKLYEPQEGVYNQAYIDHMKQILSGLNTRGWYVQLIPGFHYTPDWVYANYPDVYFVNQYGEIYNPDPISAGDFRVINAPFSPQARTLIAGYLQRIFSVDFPQNEPALRFDSVRVGGGPQGELRYPPAEWNGHSNSFWAFDASAQNATVSAIPASIQGWRPGIDPNPGSAGRGQLIVNPGFEKQHPYYSILGWSPDDEVVAQATTSDVRSGSRALSLTINTTNRIHQYVRVKPSTAYQFGGWVKSITPGGRSRIFVTQYDQATQPVSGAAFTKLESTSVGWVELSGEIVSSPGTTFFKIELDGDRAGSYLFDDLWLHENGETNIEDRDIQVPTAFFDWYVDRMTDYQNWQITELRKYFSGTLDIVYAGKGIRSMQVTDALCNDLRGDGWSENSSALYAAADYARHINNIATPQNLAIYLTGIENPPDRDVDDRSPYPSQWSAARWVSYLAKSRSLPVWGENSGRNTYQEMALTLERMRDNNFVGILWAFESHLYSDPGSTGYATANDYEAFIQFYTNEHLSFLPITLAGR